MHDATNAYALDFLEMDKTKLVLVGGKAANLGELSKIDGINVPPGFCVTTNAYKSIVERIPQFDALLDQLVNDVERVRELSKEIRNAIEATPISTDIEEAINDHLTRLGLENSYAVRSSATAEDLPSASFAG